MYEVTELAEKIIESGVQTRIGVPTLSYTITDNLGDVTKEVGNDLFELRYILIAGRKCVYILVNTAIICAGAYTIARSMLNYKQVTT